MTGIPLSSLPKTFLDAIVVTKALGLRYLWIDSLCIIQDNEDDWLAESKTMGTLYERAVITLAASTAPDSTYGLFLERPYSELQVPSVQLPFIRRDTTSGVQEVLGHYSIGIEWRQEPFMTQIDPMETPLSKQGWATQEWILSRRIVHFLDQGMVWVCRRHAEDESGQQIIGRGLPNVDWAPE
jgi:Heterokaryon incompatibility protein (HET)